MLLVSAAIGAVAPMAAGADGERTIALGDMEFSWHHRATRLFGRLSAPGTGWLAVGFNEDRTLRGTRFVIAAVAGGPPRAEVHIALPPDHRPVADVTGHPADLRDLDGGFDHGRSKLSFSLPHRSADGAAPDLSPGQWVHLMLAWSHAPEFDHHSAWRGHTDVVL